LLRLQAFGETSSGRVVSCVGCAEIALSRRVAHGERTLSSILPGRAANRAKICVQIEAHHKAEMLNLLTMSLYALQALLPHRVPAFLLAQSRRRGLYCEWSNTCLISVLSAATMVEVVVEGFAIGPELPAFHAVTAA
jgi:hypothetical protein